MLTRSLGDPCTRVWFRIRPRLAVNMILRTAFKDCFIRGISPSGRLVVPLHSPLVAIVTKLKTGLKRRQYWDHSREEQIEHEVGKTSFERAAKQIVLKPRT